MTVLRLAQFDETTPEPAAKDRTLRVMLHRATGRVRRVRPEQWWLLLFVILFLAFLVAVLLQPTVGRGGR